MDLLLGHNQFLGISHISEERSREREKKFSDVKNIYKVVENAVDLGYKGMIIEPHPRIQEFLKYYKKNDTFNIDFYLQLPYVQGYIQKMNEQGLSGVIFDLFRSSGLKTTSTIAIKDLYNYIKNDYSSIAISFLELEIAKFSDIKIKAVLLHNVITDLLLSLRISKILKDYMFLIENKFKTKPGFITLNFDLFKKSLEMWNLKSPLVMTPINHGGYDMNPSKNVAEEALKSYSGEVIAMNILGGGAFPLPLSYQYLKSFENIKYCVVGASSNEHLKELIETFNI